MHHCIMVISAVDQCGGGIVHTAALHSFPLGIPANIIDSEDWERTESIFAMRVLSLGTSQVRMTTAGSGLALRKRFRGCIHPSSHREQI